MKAQDVIEKMRSANIGWLHLQFVDILGIQREYTVNAMDVSEVNFSNGFPALEASDVFEYPYVEGLRLMPIVDTYAQIPWEDRGARFLTTLSTVDGLYMKDPSYALERAIKNAKAMGISDIKVANGVEFYIFDSVAVDKMSDERGPSVMIESREGRWNPVNRYIEDRSLSSVPYDAYGLMRQQMADVLALYFNATVESHFHSLGSTGQQRINIAPASLPKAVYDLISLKYVVKTTAMINGNVATFMPLPIFKERGNSLELSFSLWKGSKNLFYDESDDLKLSENARYFIGGILEHIEALSIFTNATTNSYKRLASDPKYGAWSSVDKSSAVYVSPHISGQDEAYITLTFPDPASNPYLIYSAILSAGLDGIKSKIEPPDILDESPNLMTSREKKKYKVKSLPSSVMDAVHALNSDNGFIKGIIPPELLAVYLEAKMTEHKENEVRPTSYEFFKYLDL